MTVQYSCVRGLEELTKLTGSCPYVLYQGFSPAPLVKTHAALSDGWRIEGWASTSTISQQCKEAHRLGPSRAPAPTNELVPRGLPFNQDFATVTAIPQKFQVW